MNVLDRKVVTEKERFVAWRAKGRILVLSPLMNSWTQHMHYYYTFLADIC